MTAPRIALLSLAPSRALGALARRIGELEDGAARLIDLSGPLPPMAVGDGGVVIDGLDAGGLRAVLVHGFRYEDPVVPAASDHLDFALWQAGYPADQQRYSALYSLLARLEALPLTVWTGSTVHLAAFARPAVLEAWRRDGLAVPDLQLTNDPQVAAAFAEGRAAVWRTATGRCAWQRFGARQRLHLVGPERPPVLLAEAVAGPAIRSFVLDGRLVLSLETAPPDAAGLEQLEAFRAVAVSAAAAQAVRRAASLVGAGWAMVLWVDGADGPVLYDIDVDPILDGLPENFSAVLVEHLAAALLGRPAPVLPEPAPAGRQTLFLRRMLRILFDIEATKHRALDTADERPQP